MKKFLALTLCIALLLAGCMGSLNVKNLSGDELVTALAFPLSDFENLSPEEKTAYTAACLDLEIMNGGLCQFFANCPDCAAFVPEALDRLGAAEHKALYEQFLADNAIDPLDPMFQTESIEEFSRLYDRYPWDDFDTPYCALTPMSELLEAYIQANPDAF
jgi:hypothetical protein